MEMSCTASPLCNETGSVQEFPFDGVYAGLASPRQEDEQRLKRQPKRRRGLWQACFAQPRADETSAPSALRSTPSKLTLTGDGTLAFRRTGSPETRRIPISKICDVQQKWIEAAGVRVSKVTLTIDSGKEPIVIRGLKNPQEFLEAIKRRQQAAADQRDGLPHEYEPAGRSSAGAPGSAPATPRWREGSGSPAKHMTPRALFADATGSPVSGGNSGTGGMTLLSAFARSPAQDFAGASSVAREIELASPGRDDDSYTSSLESMAAEAAPEPELEGAAAAAAAVAAAEATDQRAGRSAAAGPGGVQEGRQRAEVEAVAVAATAAPPPPHQPSDSLALPAAVSMSSMVQSPAPRASAARAAGSAAGGDPDPSPAELMAGVELAQQSPRGPGVAGLPPAPRLMMGGSPPMPAEDSVMGGTASSQLTPESSPRPTRQLVGGSPPPRAEDSAPESLQSSPPASRGQAFATGAVPTGVDVNARRSASVRLSAGSPGSAATAGADLPHAASVPLLHEPLPAGQAGEEPLPRSASDMRVRLAEASFSSRARRAGGEEVVRGAVEPPVELPLARGASHGSGSADDTPRLVPPAAKQRNPHEGSRRLAQDSSDGAGGPAAPRVSGPEAAAAAHRVPRGRWEAAESPFESASSGELADSPAAALSPVKRSTSTPMVREGGGVAGGSASEAAGGGAGAAAALTSVGSGAKGPVGTLGIAAAAATVSAVLTSAASASFGSVGLSAAPSLAGSASVAAGSTAATAAASVAAAPLTLMGLTMAAAVTLVAAAAVTHIRTGSPLRPLESPYDWMAPPEARVEVQPTAAAAAPPPPLLMPPPQRVSSGQLVAESPTSWFGGGRTSASYEGDGSEATTRRSTSVSGRGLDGGSRRESTTQVPVGAGAPTGLQEQDEKPESEPAMAAERSWCGTRDVPGGSIPHAEVSLASARGPLPRSGGGGSEGAATSGAWGSNPNLIDAEAEQATEATAALAVGAAGPPARARELAPAGSAAAAGSTNPSEHHYHPDQAAVPEQEEEEREPLPWMLFEGPAAAVTRGSHTQVPAADATAGPDGPMPPPSSDQALVHMGEGLRSAAAPSQARVAPSAAAAEPEPDAAARAFPGVAAAGGGAAPAPVDPIPVAQVAPRSRPPAGRDPTVRQLLPDFDDSVVAGPVVAAPLAYEESSRRYPQHQQRSPRESQSSEEAEVYAAPHLAAVLRAAPPHAALPAGDPAPAAAATMSPGATPTLRRRAQQLTESPVRVLYSVHASFTGLPPADPRVMQGLWPAPQQTLAPPLPERCESAVQTEAPLAECAVQTNGAALASARSGTASSLAAAASASSSQGGRGAAEWAGALASASEAVGTLYPEDARAVAPPVGDPPRPNSAGRPVAAAVVVGGVAADGPSRRCSGSGSSSPHPRRRSSGSGGSSGSSSGAPPDLTASAVQQVFSLESPREEQHPLPPQQPPQQPPQPVGGASAKVDRAAATMAEVGSGRSGISPAPLQAGAQDWYMSSVGIDSQLGAGGFDLAAPAVTRGARDEHSTTLSTPASSSALSPWPSAQDASPSVAGPPSAGGAPRVTELPAAGRSPGAPSCGSRSAATSTAPPAFPEPGPGNEEAAPLLGRLGRSSDCGIGVSHPHAVWSSQCADATPVAVGATSSSADEPGVLRPEPQLPAGCRHLPEHRLAAGPASSASQGSSSTDSPTLSPSVTGGSVGSGMYSPMASQASSSDGGGSGGSGGSGSDGGGSGSSDGGGAARDVAAAAWNRGLAIPPHGADGDAEESLTVDSDVASGRQRAGSGALQEADSEQAGSEQAGSEQPLLSPEVPLSAEPPVRWPRPGAFAVSPAAADATSSSSGSSSPSASTAQQQQDDDDDSDGVDGVGAGAGGRGRAPDTGNSTAAVATSRLTLDSDTADDMVWLLAAAAAHTSDEPGAGEAYADSAPDSPRMPPPPSIASSTSNHSSPCSRGQRATYGSLWDQAAAEVEAEAAARRGSSSMSSIGSCGGRRGGEGGSRLAPRGGPGSCASSASSSAYSGTRCQRADGSGGSWPDGNQLATPLSSGACGSAVDRAAAAHVRALNTSSAGSNSSSRGSGMSGSSGAAAGRGFSGGPFGGVAAVAEVGGVVDSPPGVGGVVMGGGAAAVAGSLASDSPVPHPQSSRTSGPDAAGGTPVSPDLSDISSPGCGGAAYVYGTPYGRDTADEGAHAERGGACDGAGAAAGAGPIAAGAAGEEADDLFQNPLYSTPRQVNTADKAAAGAQQQRNGSGAIALSLAQYSEGQSYGGFDGNGTGSSTCTSSPEVISSLQPAPQEEVPAVIAGRRRTREEAATSSYRYDDGTGVRPRAGEEEAGASSRGAPAAAGGGAGGGSGGGSSSAGSPPQNPKRPRMQPEAMLPAAASAPVDLQAHSHPPRSPEEQQQQQRLARQMSMPVAPKGARGLPLVSPMMVLNPTYAQSAASQSAGASPAVDSPPQGPQAERGDEEDEVASANVVAMRLAAAAQPPAPPPGQAPGQGTMTTPFSGALPAEEATHARAAVVLASEVRPEADVRKVDTGDGTLAAGGFTGSEPRTPLHLSPRHLHVMEREWSGVQGSPSSQQAAHAAELLRHANDAVDGARDAVQRGDARWLARVTATLQAVQSALDALREF